MSSTPVEFTKERHINFTGTIKTNPTLVSVESGFHTSDFVAGFGNQNYVCVIEFGLNETHLITWRTVMERKHGRHTGVASH